jgi:hypothetical protein
MRHQGSLGWLSNLCIALQALFLISLFAYSLGLGAKVIVPEKLELENTTY